jgi:hypothetical protein
VTWRDKGALLTNMHKPPVERNLCDDHGNSVNLKLLQTIINTKVWIKVTE